MQDARLVPPCEVPLPVDVQIGVFYHAFPQASATPSTAQHNHKKSQNNLAQI
jgi:hypothetical protein